MYDLYFLTIHFAGGAEQPDLPGALALPAPRRAGRGRESDQFLALLSLPEAFSMPAAQQKDVLQQAANAYFSTSSSVTSGLRSAAEAVNAALLKCGPVLALLNLVAVHRGSAYMAHCGPAHSLLLNIPRSQLYHDDPAVAGQGLGLGGDFRLTFNQFEIQKGDLLLMSPNPPQNFTPELLAGSPRSSLELARRRLLAAGAPGLQVMLVQFQAGKGQIHSMRVRSAAPMLEGAAPFPVATPSAAPQPSAVPAGVQAEAPAASQDAPPAGEAGGGSAETSITAPAGTPAGAAMETPANAPTQAPPRGEPLHAAPLAPPSKALDAQPVLYTVREAPAPRLAAPLTRPRRRRSIFDIFQRPPQKPAALQPTAPGMQPGIAGAPGAPAMPPARLPDVEPAASVPLPTRSAPPAAPAEARPDTAAALKQNLVALWARLRSSQGRLKDQASRLTARVIPGSAERLPTLSTSWLLFISVAVPLAVAALATTIYFRDGAGKQYEVNFEQAKKFASQAHKQDDRQLKKSLYEQTISTLEKARRYRTTDESQDLLVEASQQLDLLNHVQRMNLQPLRDALDPSIQVQRIVANSVEFYLLDAAKGRILRFFRTGQEYVIDNEFACSSGRIGAAVVGPLVDMVLLPPNKNKATIAGVDASGNMLYCIPGGKATTKMIPPPPATDAAAPGWGAVGAVDMDAGVLYLLDTLKRYVYFFYGENAIYSKEPHLFFNADVPDLSEAADIAMIGQDLFVLKRGGSVARCTLRSTDFDKTRFVDPAPLLDVDGSPTEFLDANFIQVQTTQPPDPSVFLLDANTSALYHFGLGLTLQRKLMLNPFNTSFAQPKRPASAFAVSPNRVVILAFGNEVFYGQLP